MALRTVCITIKIKGKKKKQFLAVFLINTKNQYLKKGDTFFSVPTIITVLFYIYTNIQEIGETVQPRYTANRRSSPYFKRKRENNKGFQKELEICFGFLDLINTYIGA